MSQKQSFQFFTFCIGLMLFGLWLMLCTASCTVVDKTKDVGVVLEPMQKLVTIGWNGTHIHYVTRPMRLGETAEVYKIFEPLSNKVSTVYEMGSSVPDTATTTDPFVLPPVVKRADDDTDDDAADDDDSCVDISVDDDEDVLTSNVGTHIN